MELLTSSTRGQFFSYDAIIGSTIFIVALSLLLAYWQGSMAVKEDLPENAISFSQSLLSPAQLTETPGTNVISLEKFGLLRGMSESDYEGLKGNLSISSDYWVELSGDKLDCAGACSFGKEPPKDAEQAQATRLVVLGGKPAVLKIVLWNKAGGS